MEVKKKTIYQFDLTTEEIDKLYLAWYLLERFYARLEGYGFKYKIHPSNSEKTTTIDLLKLNKLHDKYGNFTSNVNERRKIVCEVVKNEN